MGLYADFMLIIAAIFLNHKVMCIVMTGKMFYKVTINSARLTPSTILDSYTTDMQSSCAHFCNMNAMYNVFCIVDDICKVINIPVSNQFVESSLTDPIICYTSLMEKEIIPAAPVDDSRDKTNFSIVSLNKDWLHSVHLSKSESPFLTDSGCMDACRSSVNCTAVCIENNKCITTDMLVAPGYTDAIIEDPITCYTILKPDLLFGVKSFSLPLTKNTIKSPEYLTKGIHNRESYESCVKLFDSTGPWMYFDFEKEVSFTKMVMTTQVRETTAMRYIPYNTIVYSGNTDPQITDMFTDHSDFTEEFRFPGSNIEPQTTYIYSVNVTNKRFLGFKREKYVENDKYLVICYLELYN